MGSNAGSGAARLGGSGPGQGGWQEAGLWRIKLETNLAVQIISLSGGE